MAKNKNNVEALKILNSSLLDGEIDHSKLANTGIRTHEEIDTEIDEIKERTSSIEDIKDYKQQLINSAIDNNFIKKNSKGELVDANCSEASLISKIGILNSGLEDLTEDELIEWMESANNGVYTLSTLRNGQELFMKGVVTKTNVETQKEEKTLRYARYISDGRSFEWIPSFNDWSLAAGSGGGGGSSSGGTGTTSIRLYAFPIGTDTTISAAADNSLELSIQYQNSEVTTGTLKLYRNDEMLSLSTINTGITTIDVGKYVRTGSNTFDFTVSDALANESTVTYLVTGVNLSITSDYSDATINPQDFSIIFDVNGEGNRTVSITLDGETTTQSSTTVSNSFKMKGLSHGVHSLLIQAETDIGTGTLLHSNILEYNLVVAEKGNDTTIISSKFADNQEVDQGTNLSIDYIVYKESAETLDVDLLVDGEVFGTVTADKTRHYWNTNSLSVGAHTLSLRVGEISKTFSITIKKLDIDFQPIEDDYLKLFLTANGRTNLDNDKEILANSHGEEVKTYLRDFNYTTNGWIDNALVFNGNAKSTIMYKPFKEEVSINGLTLEFELETENDYGAGKTFIECMDSNNRGIRIMSDRAILKSSDTTVLTLFKENDKIKIAFVINKYNNTTTTYVNGVMSGIDRLSDVSKFIQNVPRSIFINHDGMGGKLYNIRVYNRSLSSSEILQNYLNDDTSVSDKIYQYKFSDIFDGSGNPSYDKIKDKLPILKIRVYDQDENGNYFPQTKSFKPKVDLDFENPFDNTRNYSCAGVTMKVQGSSTLQYPVKNYRFILPDDNFYTINPEETRPTQILCLKVEYMESSLSTDVGMCRLFDQMYDEPTPVHAKDGLSRTSTYGYPICIFKDDGSDYSFMGLYCLNTDKSDPQMFGHYPDNGFPESRRFEVLFNADDNAVSYARTGKNLPVITDDMTEEEKAAEIDRANTEWFKEVAIGFEGNYPKQENGVYDAETNPEGQATLENYQPLMDMLSRVSEWETIPNEELAAYKEEINERMDFDYAARYMLACFITGAVDSFGKDMLVNTWGKGKKADGTPSEFFHWYLTFYDMDTCMGIDNQGRLTDSNGVVLYDYDIDFSDDVFMQSTSRLWEMYATLFKKEVASKYEQMRNEDFNFETMWKYLYDNQIAKFSKGMYNANAQMKYVETPGAENWLWMLNGDRINQLRRWLTNRLYFLDSKYGYNIDKNIISARINSDDLSKVEFTLTPDIHYWVSDKLGNNVVGEDSKRTKAGTPVTLTNSYSEGTAAPGMELTIYGAEHIIDLGDFGHNDSYQVIMLDIGSAVNLRTLDMSLPESDSTLITFSTGVGTNLESLNLENNAALNGALDLSGCINLKYLNLKGTNYSSVVLPVGGILEECYLPKTLTSLYVSDEAYLTKYNFTVEDGCSLDFLRIENCSGIDFYKLIDAVKDGGAIRVMGITLSAFNDYPLNSLIEKLNGKVGLDYKGETIDSPVITGECRIMDTEKKDYSSIENYFSGVEFIVNSSDSRYITSSELNERDHFDLIKYTGTEENVKIVSLNSDSNLSADNLYDYDFKAWNKIDGIGDKVFGSGILSLTISDEIISLKSNSITSDFTGYLRTTNDEFSSLWEINNLSDEQKLTGEKRDWEIIDGYLTGENKEGTYLVRKEESSNEIYLPTKLSNETIPYRALRNTLDNCGSEVESLYIPTNYTKIDTNFTDLIDNSSLIIWSNYSTIPTGFNESWNILNRLVYLNAPAEKVDYNFHNGDEVSTINVYGVCKISSSDAYATYGIYSDAELSEELFFNNKEVSYLTDYYLGKLSVNAEYTYNGTDGYEISGFDLNRIGEGTGYLNIKVSSSFDDGINGNLPVKSVVENVFGNSVETDNGNYIESIVFEDNADFSNTFPEYEFANLVNCNLIILPKSIVDIPDYGFENTNCNSFDFSNIHSIGKYSFSNCGLDHLSLTDNTDTVGTSAFTGNSITDITMVVGDIVLGDNLLTNDNNFRDCYSTYKDGVYQIKDGSWFQLMELPTGEEYFTIDKNGLITDYNIDGGTDVVMPTYIGTTKIIGIGDNAFKDKGLTSITLRKGLESIGKFAFSGNNIVSVLIPDSVTEIKTLAFEGIEKNEVTLGAGEQEYITYSKDRTIFYGGIAKNSFTAGIFTIEDSVTTIGESAFKNSKTTSIICGAGILTIEDNAFLNSSITDISNVKNGYTLGNDLFIENNNDFKDFYNENGMGTYTLENGTWVHETPWDKEWSLDNFVYTEDDSSITITDLAKDVIDCNIPARANGKWVYLNMKSSWHISNYCSYFTKSLENLNIQSSSKITDLNIYSEDLVSVGELPSGLTSLKFRYCTSLTTIPEIPDLVTNCSGMFYKCTSLINAPEIPNSVTNCSSMFDDCTSLVNAPEIPDSVTTCYYMFKNCSNLVNAPEIGNSVTNCNGMFSSCSSLVNAPTIPDSVTNCSAMFFSCSSLKTAPAIGNSVTDCSKMFYDCSNLVNAPTIGNSATDCSNMFYDCSSLETAPAIPDSVTDCSNMFSYCSSLVNAPTIGNLVTDCSYMFFLCSSLVNAPVIGNSVTDCNNMFYSCSSLVNVPIIGNSVTNCSSMFDSCPSLKTAPEISSSVTDCSKMFYNCTSLETAPAIPDSVTNCSYMFGSCTPLINAPTIGNSVTNCNGMFYNCLSLVTASEIPDLVTNCSNMFKKCSNLVNAPVIGNSVTDCNNMFNGCTSLKTASTIPNSVTDCNNMFSYCSSLETAPVIPNSVTNCKRMFFYCSSLETAPEIPDSVTDCSEMFSNCGSLVNTSIIGNSVTTSYRMFNSCYSLKIPPAIPDSVTDCSEMFRFCYALKIAPVIPDLVTNCEETFVSCYRLVKAPEIPALVTNCYQMFDDCNSLIGNVIFRTNKIKIYRGAYNLFSGTSLPKDVYIPYSDFNSTNSTKQAFDSEGIDGDDGVTVHDLTTCPYFDLSDFVYTEDDDSITITDLANDVVDCNIPAKFNGKWVYLSTTDTYNNSTGYNCNRFSKKLVNLNIQNGSKITELYFYSEDLVSIGELPFGIEKLNFEGCSSLVNVSEIPDSATDCSNMFYGCSSLVNVPEIPDLVTDCSNMFYGCSSLKTAPTIGNSVTSCNSMFYNCTSLETAPEIPNLVTDCSAMFNNCTSLTGDIGFRTNKLNISNGVSSLFANTSLPKNVYLPYDDFSDTNSTKQAFDAEEIDGNNGVTVHDLTTYRYFDLSDFVYTEKDDSITITDLANDVIDCNIPAKFNGKDVYLDASHQISTGYGTNDIFSKKLVNLNIQLSSKITELYFCSEDLISIGELPLGLKKMRFNSCTSLVNAPEIPNLVTDCSYMFESCTSLVTAPEIPDSVTNCSGMFESCTSLVNAPEIPNSVTTCYNMFKDCDSLETAPVIGNSVTDCSAMFEDCDSLVTAPEIPNSVTNCSNMFWECRQLTGNIIFRTNKLKYTDINGINGADSVFANTYISKDVYIPYDDFSDTNSTKRAFDAAEIDGDYGVTVHDLATYTE